MPTATAAFQYGLVNLGPLTTTFTPDPSCATASNLIQIVAKTDPEVVSYNADCAHLETATVAGCYPSGAAFDALGASHTADAGLFGVAYFSPASICPGGWNTVGVAARDKDGKYSSSGAFTLSLSTTASTSGIPTLFNPPDNAIMSALDPGETAVLCCPSSMTTAAQGYCYSTLPDFKITAGCLRLIPNDEVSVVSSTVNLYGSTITAGVVTFINTIGPTTTETTTFVASETSSLVAVSAIAMVRLVHRAEDTPASSKTNAASPGRMGSAGGGAAGQWAFLVCLVSMTMGSVFVISLLG